MNFNNMLNFISRFTMKGSSAFSDGLTSFLAATASNPDAIAAGIVDGVSNFFYCIVKWMLYVLDVMFAYVQELSGLNMSYESLDSLLAPESDMVFNLLTSGQDVVIPLVRNLVGLAIILIIIFSIIALVKAQFSMVEKNDPKVTKGVFLKLGKSLALLLITPFMAVVGIIASDLILQALYQATNPMGSVSLGTQLFSTSATSANLYRDYAMNGQRIPITYDFTKEKEILDYYQDKPASDTFIEYLQSSNNLAYTTYVMFSKDDFQTFDSLNTCLFRNPKVEEQEELYYKTYDVSLDAVGSSDLVSKYKRIESYQAEYMVMADLVDYLINSSNVVYFKTIEDVLKSMALIYEYTGNAEVFNDFVDMRGIQFIDSNNEVVDGEYPIDKFNGNQWQLIRYSSNYYGPDPSGEAMFKTPISYNHVKGATDEREGAKFVVAVEKTSQELVNGTMTTMTYFEPLLKGYTTFGKGRDFESDYIGNAQIISAKGVFYDGKYPTAIKLAEDRSTVQFYREEVLQLVIGDSDELGNLTVVPEESKGIFNKIGRFFKALFKPESLVPKLEVNNNAMVNAYTSQTVTANELADGKLHISYMYADGLTSALGTTFQLKLNNLFAPRKINYLILVMGVFLLIKVTFKAVFALIARAYELFLIILVYPTACASLPLDDGGWKTWVQKYMGRLFSTYGLLLGINFVLLLFPVIETIEVFSIEEVGTNLQIRRVGGLFFRFMSVNLITKMLNLVMTILFQLVAFTLIESIPEMISVITKSEKSKNDPVKAVTQSAKVAFQGTKFFFGNVKGGAMGVAKALFSPSYRQAKIQQAKDKINKVKESVKNGAIGMIPGSAIYGAAKDKINLINKAVIQQKAKRELKSELASGSASSDDISKKFNELAKKQEAYTKAIKDPTDARKAEEDKRRQARRTGTSKREKYDDNLDGTDYNDKTGRQLRREKRKTNKYLRRLNRKAKSSGLTAEEREAQRIFENKKNNIIQEQQSRKSGKKEVDKKLDEIKALEKKANTAGLSAEEAERIKTLKGEIQEFNNNEKGRKQRSKVQDKRIKNQRKQRHKEAKEEQKALMEEKRINDAFRHTDKASRKIQNEILNGLSQEKSSIEQALKNTGFNQNIGELSVENINELISQKDKNGLTDEQSELLTQYAMVKGKENKFMEKLNNEYAGKARVEAKSKELKSMKVAARRIPVPFVGKMLRQRRSRKLHVGADEQARLAEVQQQIQALGTIDGSNSDQFFKLKQEESKLQARIQTDQAYTGMVADRKGTRQNLKAYKQSIKDAPVFSERVQRIFDQKLELINKERRKEGKEEYEDIRDYFEDNNTTYTEQYNKEMERIRSMESIRRKRKKRK